MNKSKLLSIVPFLCASFLVAGCPDDSTEPSSETNNNDSSTSDSDSSDPTTNSSVTLTTSTSADTTDSDPTTTTTMTTTMTTDDTSSSTDPTNATESSSSTDPTNATESSSSSTDPTATESSSSGDPSATGTDTGTPACVDVDLDSDLPVAYAGSNEGFGDDFIPSCIFAGEGSMSDEDITFEWTATAAGTYQIDTLGSDLDSEIMIYDTCGGEEVACAEDTDDSLQSVLQIDLAAGQTILIVVDSYDTPGDFTLNITEVLPNMGDPYGNCFADEVAIACSPSEMFCLVDNNMAPTAGACTQSPCDTEADCPAAPATGDAPVACIGLGMGGGEPNACLLDCSAGQTCPDGMECIGDFFCGWTS